MALPKIFSTKRKAPAPSQEGTPVAKAKQGKWIIPASLVRPHITEKATALAERGQYVFEVVRHATKGQVAEAVRGRYGVTVTGVRMIRIPSKRIRAGRYRGTKPGYRKAIVHLKEGQKIDIVG